MPTLTRHFFLSFFFLIFCGSVYAQLEEEEFYYGFNVGINSSSIQEIQTTIIRPVFPTETYSTSSNNLLGFTAGAFVYYKFKKSKFAIQPEINYVKQGGVFHYEDIEDLTYDIQFNYSYINIAPIVKFYTVHGLYASAGAQLGIILDRSDLTYTSNMPEVGPDLQIQQSLREVLKGNNQAAIILGVGYDTPFGLNLNVRWIYSISDAVETLANGYYFIENKNPSQSIQFTVGYHIPFFK